MEKSLIKFQQWGSSRRFIPGGTLEFKAVAVMACDEGVLPQQERMEAIGDDADLEMVYETERHFLYVACTRARDHLLLTGFDPASELLETSKFVALSQGYQIDGGFSSNKSLDRVLPRLLPLALAQSF